MAYRRTPQMQSRLDAARDRILHASSELVARGGWGAATIVAVARQAGVATGTVYKHVSGKDELFAEVFRRAAGQELGQVAAAAEGSDPPLIRLEAALRVFAERALRGRQLAYALLAEPAGAAVEAERLTYRADYRRLFRDLLEEAVAAGDLPPHDESVAAAVLIGAMSEVLVGPLAAVTQSPEGSQPDRQPGDRQVDELVAACLRALPRSG